MLDFAYIRYASNFDVYDGDSLRCDCDEGDYRKEEQRPLRLYGIDTPELAPLWDPHYGGQAGKKDPEQVAARDKEKAAGEESRDRVLAYLSAATGTVLVQTIKLPGREVRDKYGRTLSRIFVPVDEVWIDIAGQLIAEGHARPYAGGNKPKWAFLRDPQKTDPSPQAVAAILKAA